MVGNWTAARITGRRDGNPAELGGWNMNPIEVIRQYEELRAAYAEYAGEARACGEEVLSFEDWAGLDSPKRRAEERWQHHFDNDTLDLY